VEFSHSRFYEASSKAALIEWVAKLQIGIFLNLEIGTESIRKTLLAASYASRFVRSGESPEDLFHRRSKALRKEALSPPCGGCE